MVTPIPCDKFVINKQPVAIVSGHQKTKFSTLRGSVSSLPAYRKTIFRDTLGRRFPSPVEIHGSISPHDCRLAVKCLVIIVFGPEAVGFPILGCHDVGRNVGIQVIIRKHLHIFLSELLLDTVRHRYRMERRHESAAAAGRRHTSVRPHDQHTLTLAVRKFAAPILQHHNTLACKFQCRSRIFRIILFNAFVQYRLVQKPEPVQCRQYVIYLPVNGFLRNDAGFYKRHDPFFSKIHALGAFQVKTAVHGSGCGIYGSPVGHENAVEAPHVAEDLHIHISIFRCMNAENRIVAGHDGSDMSLLDCFPECREIYFMKCPLIHVRTCMMAAPFLIVGRKMLDGGYNAFRLYTFYIMFCDFRGQIRVLAEIFEIPAVHRSPVDVHARSEQYGHSPGLGVFAQTMTEFFCQIPVPCSGGEYSGRIKSADSIVAYALGAVRHTDLRYAQPVHAPHDERSNGTYIITLFLQCHFRYEFTYPGVFLVGLYHVIYIVAADSHVRNQKKKN